MKNIATKIRELRKANKMNQVELAKLMGVGKTTISNWETSYSSPDPDSLVRLSNIFNCSVDYLLGSEYIEGLKDELKDYRRVAKMAKDAKITPEQLEEQVKVLRNLLGR
jgi:transcriptional regulator with XRE-family HTH domain